MAARNHCSYNIAYHIVFCPKRRKPILVDAIASDCRDILHQVADDFKLKIEAVEIMPDHVHVFVYADPKISPFSIAKRFKGRTSKILREKYPQLKRTPCMWSSSYYIGTVGHVSDSVVKMYIESQKGK